jgi:2-dehydropantoate 2-reductase
MALRILIVGAGAVGGYFGGRLAQAGRDVTFLVRASRAKQLGQDGLRIISPHGDAVLSPKLISADKIDAFYDIIFLSVKAYALEAAMNDFAAAVGPETIIFPVLNGMRHIDILTKRFGEHAVIGGVCLVAAEIDHQGHAAAMTAPGSSLTSSMYRDLRNGAPVEADQILGDFIERGSAHGVTTPLLKAAFVNLRVYQDRLPRD